jgi:uroporphyrinogen III methyltransferase/synthase
MVHLVGAGPGDPGLITLRGEEVLSRAEVVIYDHLVHPRLLDHAPARALRIFAGKRAGRCALQQPEINDLLVQHARAGRRVVRLKGGDPYVFGRGAEEAEHLRAAGIPFEVVPGVTAGVGVTSYAGVPVTHRDVASAVAFVTGHDDPTTNPRLDWSALAQFPGTLVIYMGVSRLQALCEILVGNGKASDTPAALVHSGTNPQQRTLVSTLSELPVSVAHSGLGPPALVVIGDVVARRPALAWYEQLPLFGQRILVTRPDVEARLAAASLEARGAEALVAPMVAIRPVANPSKLDDAIDRLATFDWLVFTSSNGVRHFIDRLKIRGRDLRALGNLRLAAIGPATAQALAGFHLTADVIPDEFRSEALAEALVPAVRGGRVLLARADRGRTLLKDELVRVAAVEQVAVYENADIEALTPDVEARLAEGSIDWVTLTSSAITDRLARLIPPEAQSRIARGQIRLASISPVTSATAAKHGWRVAVEAHPFTWDGLVSAIELEVARCQHRTDAAVTTGSGAPVASAKPGS